MTITEPLLAPVVPELVWFSGADAIRFLNDLISQEIGDVEPGTVGRSLLLTPQGKLDHLLWVLRGEGEVGLIVDSGRGEDLAAKLARYRIRVDVEIEIVIDGLTTQAKYYKPLVYEFMRKEWVSRPSWGDFAVDIRMEHQGDPPHIIQPGIQKGRQHGGVRRLRVAALGHEQRLRLAVGGVAAAIVLIVGVGVLFGRDNGLLGGQATPTSTPTPAACADPPPAGPCS